MKITAIDTHCHPQFPHYDTDRSEVISRASNVGVGMICIGTNPVTSLQAVQLANENDGMWAAIGVHPNESHDIKDYQSLFHEPKVVAVGEIGLDFYRQPDPALQQLQEEIFIRQLDLADRYHLPCIIHCRDAHERMSEILSLRPHTKGVIHSFNGTAHQALFYIDAGWYIGLNGIVTFSSQYEEMMKALPSDRILLETDAPYLSPAPYRGKRNEPVRILDIAKRIKDIRGDSDYLANTLQCFGGISMAAL